MEQKTIIPGLYKVDESLVINKDNDGLKAYKKRKIKNAYADKVQSELKSLKNEIVEIKNLLKGLIK